MSKESDMDPWEEAVEASASAPRGTYKKFVGKGTGIEYNLSNFVQNLPEVFGRVDYALQSRCWIEAITLRHQLIDYWLRVYFVNMALPEDKRPQETKRLLKRCKELGLDADLYRRISDFNTWRNAAVHGFVVGTTTYEALERVAREAPGLSNELIIYVLENSGEDVTPASSPPDNAGFFVNVQTYTVGLRSIGLL